MKKDGARRQPATYREQLYFENIVVPPDPRIMQPDQQTKKYPVATGYDIWGSANWFNPADLGITAYRREEGFIEGHCWKARFPAFGAKDGKARMILNAATGRLTSSGGQRDSRPEQAGARAQW